MTADAGLVAETASLGVALSRMGDRCAAMVDDGVEALLSSRGIDPQLAAREADLDALEVAIDEKCLRILALRRPLGMRLRLVATAMKLVVDLERVGDLAMNIAERGRGVRLSDPQIVERIQTLAASVGNRLRDAVAAVVAHDGAGASALLARERGRTNALADELVELQLAGVAAGALGARQGLALASIAKYLARVGDHADNIAEMAVFLAQGDDVRHPRVHRAPVGDG